MGKDGETHSRNQAGSRDSNGRLNDIRELDRRLLLMAYRGDPGIQFYREVCRLILDDSGCDNLELLFGQNHKFYRCRMSIDIPGEFKYEILPSTEELEGIRLPVSRERSRLDEILRVIIKGTRAEYLSDYYSGNSICLDDVERLLPENPDGRHDSAADGTIGEGRTGSAAFIPVEFCYKTIGALQLTSGSKHYFEKSGIEMYEGIGRTLGIALMTQQAQAALRERVKELTCLYSIARVAERDRITLEGILEGIAELLPRAWQYPEVTAGRIVLDNRVFSSPGFQEAEQRQRADINSGGVSRGFVEVVYTSPMPDLDEGPFLREERSLIDAIAREVAMIVERKEAEEEKGRLQEQLRHADRLATIGQLAAGVAHEINEPLGNMLGFAQLARKHPGLPEQAEKDLAKIEAASLHAREIVKKLMLFSRQMPPQKTRVNINKMIDEGLYFIKSRCKKSNIEIILSLEPELPEITADQSQIYQVLVNLVVNAVQAMPDGGRLTIATKFADGHVIMSVEDNGVGMDEETQKKIFLPFFTTKEINEGTGIGLSVVHGIITLHGGRIEVASEPGRGTRFDILLPINNRTENMEKTGNGGNYR